MNDSSTNPATIRLDLFLRNTGLIKQRARAKRLCSEERVFLNGETAKAAQPVRRGDYLRLELDWRLLELEILTVPNRPVPRGERSRCYRIAREEDRDPYQDLEF